MTKKSKKQTEAQLLLGIHLRELGIETIEECGFSRDRDWRLDLYCARLRLAFEIDGGQWSRGHRSAFWGKKEALRRKAKGLVGTPIEDEKDKYNSAQMEGIRILSFTNDQVNDGRAKAFLESYMKELVTNGPSGG